LTGPREHRNCVDDIQALSQMTDILEGKWKLQILCAMRDEPVRLSQLTRLLPSASKKALRANLRALESAQIVVRRDMSTAVLHVEYDFAEDMRTIIGSLLDQLNEWGRILEAKKRARKDL
jgi:DNA-binding HxlR family transcriptional regulator